MYVKVGALIISSCRINLGLFTCSRELHAVVVLTPIPNYPSPTSYERFTCQSALILVARILSLL